MSFLNIQLGGSIFQHEETRQKNFVARFDIEAARRMDTPFGAQERDAIEWAKAHEFMYDEAMEFLESCRSETKRKDALAMEFARNRDADEERKRAPQPRDRGDRPEPEVSEPAKKGTASE